MSTPEAPGDERRERSRVAMLRFSSETTSNGVSERLFTLDDLPGVL